MQCKISRKMSAIMAIVDKKSVNLTSNQDVDEKVEHLSGLLHFEGNYIRNTRTSLTADLRERLN